MVTRSSVQWIIIALATLTILAQANVSEAVPILTVTPNVAFRIVTEGDSGIFNFTVANVSDDTANNIRFVTSRIIADPGSTLYGNINEIRGGIEFVSDDRNDAVFSTSIVNDNCTGSPLRPRATCSFQLVFDTQDLNKPASDTNSGIWRVYSDVGFMPPEFGDAVGKATVEVLDPGATPKVPEPSTLVLLASGLAVLSGLRKGLRSPK
jgi:hypothetical protein